MRKIVYILNLFGLCLVAQNATAQFSRHYYKKHEVGISVQAGYLGMQNSVPYQMNANGGLDFGGGLHYDYYFTRKISLGIGGIYSMSHAKYEINRLYGSMDKTDSEGEKFIFNYKVNSMQEKITLNQLNIPITVAYTMDNNLYFRTGVQVGLSMTSEVETTFNQLETEGYFPQYAVILKKPEFQGFGSFGSPKETKDIEVNTRIAWVGEVGYKYELAEGQNLYIGLYFDIGLNDLKKSDRAAETTSLIDYRPIPEENRAEVIRNTAYDNAAYKLKTYAVGIKLKYGFGL